MVDERKVSEGYKVTEVGIIPDDWEVKTFGEVLKVRHGKSQHLVEEVNGKYPILATGGQIGWANQFLYDRPSVLIGRKGTIDKPQYIDKPFWTIDTLFYTEVSKLTDVKYLFYVFNMIDWYSYNEASGVPSLSSKTIEKIANAIAPFPEQKAIAEALSDTDNLILSIEKLIDKKKKINQGAMQQLLTGKKRLPGFSGEWEVRNFQQLGYFISGNGFPIKYQSNKTGKYPFYKVSDFNNIGNDVFMIKANNYIEEDSRKAISAKIIPAYAVIFAKIGAAIFLERKRISSVECCIDNNMMSFVSNTDLLFSKLAYYLFKNIQLSNLVSATALPSLSAKDIGKLEICIPEDLEEQIAIAQVLSDMDSEIEALKEKLEKVKTIKQGMMQELLTGRIRLI